MALFDQSVAAYSAIALIVTLTPGADTMLVVRNTLGRGRPGGYFSALGVASGFVIHASAAAFGLSAILLRSSDLYAAIKLLGALYLVYLGIQSIRAGLRRKSSEMEEVVQVGRPAQALREGFLSNALNPKVALFNLAFLPQFVHPTDPVLAKTFLLVGIHCTMALLWLCLVTLLVARAALALRDSRIRRRLDLLSGAIFVGLGARLALDRA